MNTIYKTIRNALTGQTAVVSELAKSKGKIKSKAQSGMTSQNSYAGIFLQLTMVILLTGVPLFAQAEDISFDNEPDKLRRDYWGNYSLFPFISRTGNTVKVINGTISGGVFGGMTNGNDEVSGNRVTILDGVVNQGIYGGYSDSGNATNNHVTIFSGQVSGSVYGGNSYTGNVTGNSVTIMSGAMDYVYGGRSNSGNATGNNVTISNAKVSNASGGWAGFGDATDNSITIMSGTMNYVYGGYSAFGNATGNSVTIFDGEFNVVVNGGRSNSGSNTGGNVISNRVTILGGVFNGNVNGGAGGSYFGSAMDNTVDISGGKVNIVNGGASVDNATGNSVNISDGEIRGSVHGGYSNSANATSNTVTISGTPQFSATGTSFFGGFNYLGIGDVFTDNTLNFSAHPVSVNKVANFEYYNFTLNPAYANTATALITAQDIVLGANPSNISDGSATPSKIAVVGIHSGNLLYIGDQFILMQAGSMTGDAQGTTTTGIAQQGISLLYDVRTDVDINGRIVTATVLGSNPNGNGNKKPGDDGNDGGNNNHNRTPAARVNPQIKALSEGYLAGAQLVMRGADLLANQALNTIDLQNNQQGWVPFATLAGQYNRYNSGSHIKSNDLLLTGGLSYQQNNLTLGALLEAGWGSYDTHNSFYNAASVKGDGNARYYGLGLIGRYNFDNAIYAEASLRFGRNRNKFDTKNIQNLATGQFANYTVTSNYASAHIGVGYILPINDKNELDLSAKYLWTQLDGKDLNVAGDNIHFDRINSHRVRLNTTLNHQYSETLTFNAGLGYEYEFDGKANATTYAIYNIDAPSVRGGTGIISLGANIKPTTNQRLSLDINASGYGGKREGVGASVRINYAF